MLSNISALSSLPGPICLSVNKSTSLSTLLSRAVEDVVNCTPLNLELRFHLSEPNPRARVKDLENIFARVQVSSSRFYLLQLNRPRSC